ncbi:MAG: Mother cell inhibitor of FtsZ [Paenibacillaceae bacterium]|nr:Mother cell inhibitor of FtsZ [Paenibacillaceae bacterium]
MKSYIASKQLCLVGKAWEVRHHLRNMLRLEENDKLELRQYLASFKPNYAGGRSRLLGQRRKPLGRSTDHRESFFPSW